MAISESLYFIYDNVNFYERYGIINIHIESGLYQETFLAGRNIIEQKVRGKSSPYFIEIEESPIILKLSFYFENGFDSEKLRAVARDLKKDFYKPLIFSSDPERIFYAICIDEPQLNHTGIGTGYITITFRCDAPYTCSPVYTSQVYDLSSNSPSGTEIELVNSGDLPIFPIIKVQVISGGSFSIINKSNEGKTISFSGLADNETIIIDMEHEEIETDLANIYRFDNMTGDYYSFPRGVNKLQIFGNVKLQFKYELRMLF